MPKEAHPMAMSTFQTR